MKISFFQKTAQQIFYSRKNSFKVFLILIKNEF